jgi:hypothetical protein
MPSKMKKPTMAFLDVETLDKPPVMDIKPPKTQA